MTVERGKDWGEPGEVPSDAVIVSTDAEAAELITRFRRSNQTIPPIGLLGGDLARTLGADHHRSLHPGAEATHMRVDVGATLIDGRLRWFVAHLVARRSWLRGRVVVVANAAFLGRWNVAPRAHPGDGRLDVLDGNLALGDRLKARRRLPAGTHLPHPGITMHRVDAAQLDFERDTPIFLDGVAAGTARSLSVRVEPDAIDVWV